MGTSTTTRDRAWAGPVFTAQSGPIQKRNDERPFSSSAQIKCLPVENQRTTVPATNHDLQGNALATAVVAVLRVCTVAWG